MQQTGFGDKIATECHKLLSKLRSLYLTSTFSIGLFNLYSLWESIWYVNSSSACFAIQSNYLKYVRTWNYTRREVQFAEINTYLQIQWSGVTCIDTFSMPWSVLLAIKSKNTNWEGLHIREEYLETKNSQQFWRNKFSNLLPRFFQLQVTLLIMASIS